MKNLVKFETVNTAKGKKFNKWHMLWMLVALNALGYTAARLYFDQQEQRGKVEAETVDFKKSYGANVEGNHTLLHWGVELLQLLRGRN